MPFSRDRLARASQNIRDAFQLLDVARLIIEDQNQPGEGTPPPEHIAAVAAIRAAIAAVNSADTATSNHRNHTSR